MLITPSCLNATNYSSYSMFIFPPRNSLGKKKIIEQPLWLVRRERMNSFPPESEMQVKLACSRLCLAGARWPVCLVHRSEHAMAQASLTQGRHWRGLREGGFSRVIKVRMLLFRKQATSGMIAFWNKLPNFFFICCLYIGLFFYLCTTVSPFHKGPFLFCTVRVISLCLLFCPSIGGFTFCFLWTW